jgi:hypothetical protein
MLMDVTNGHKRGASVSSTEVKDTPTFATMKDVKNMFRGMAYALSTVPKLLEYQEVRNAVQKGVINGQSGGAFALSTAHQRNIAATRMDHVPM